MERGKGKVIIVQGGQWGSEAKGLITHKLTLERKPLAAIRTGTVNAGHTVYYNGQAYAMQQLPVSWVEPYVLLVLGPGAYIHPEILQREVQWIAKAMDIDVGHVLGRIRIDFRCGLHLPGDTERAIIANRHHSIGTTGKGCSEAVVAKIMDRPHLATPRLFSQYVADHKEMEHFSPCICDTISLINRAYDTGRTLLVEGTQGTLLDLHLGPYPYVTHKQTQAANWLAEAGLSANVNKEIWGVYRTFPIKVAGNSGPMPGEISWVRFTHIFNSKYPGREPMVADWAIEEFVQCMEVVREKRWPDLETSEPANWGQTGRASNPEAASEIHRLALNLMTDAGREELENLWEFTTVTHKLRRIAQWDWPLFLASIRLNRPDYLALTFMNYEFPDLWGYAGDPRDLANGDVHRYVMDRVYKAGCPVGIVSFGPDVTHTHYMVGAEETEFAHADDSR